jgi:acyl carrier protein
MTSKTTIERLLTLTRRRFPDAPESLAPNDDIYQTLSIDSLQAMDLLTDLEDAFDVEIPDYELQDARTLSDIGQIIERRL